MGAGLNLVRSGAGQPLVLLHPVGLDLSCWDQVAHVLEGACEVIRLDLPGHGASPALAPGATLSDYARAVRRTLDAEGVAPAHIAGLSFGGMIAQTLGVEHGEACSSLVLAGCPATIPDAERPARAERGLLAVREGMAAVVETTLERWFTPGFMASGAAEPTRERLLRQDVEGWRAAWQAISGLHTAPHLRRVTVPALCVAGGADLAAPQAAIQAMADLIPRGSFAVLEGAPHMMQLERPEEFSALIRTHLQLG